MLLQELSDFPMQDTPGGIPQPRKHSDIELSQIDKRVIPVAVDDWLIFAKDPVTGELWYTVTEMWPEWADKNPEEMDADTFVKEALHGLKQRRAMKYRSMWFNVRDKAIQDEMDWAKYHDRVIDAAWGADIENELKKLAIENNAMVERQRPLIHKYWFS